VKRESEIQEKVTLYATSIGLIPVRINVTGRKGWPDYLYGYRGKVLFIEYKRPGEKPEPLQEYVHSQLREQWFPVLVVDNVERGKEILKHWKESVDESIKLAGFRQDHY